MPHASLVLLYTLGLLAVVGGGGDDSAAGRLAPPATRGVVHFSAADESIVPEPYRLADHDFPYELRFVREVLGTRMHRLTFPSPVESPDVENNTVYAEYHWPRGDGPFPATIVLDILGGTEDLPRIFAASLAQRGVASLFVKMPYYGERRPKGRRIECLNDDLEQTLQNVRQAVLDIRRATAWLGARAEVDPARIGVMGISFGSFMGVLAAESEPRLRRVAVLLGGGNVAEIIWRAPEGASFRKHWLDSGGTKESFTQRITQCEPLHYADNLRGRPVLMLVARQDEVVPPACSDKLWRACGQQEIIWFDAGHYTSIKYLFQAQSRILRFFTTDWESPDRGRAAATQVPGGAQ
jgi:dienelactone hydrolase